MRTSSSITNLTLQCMMLLSLVRQLSTAGLSFWFISHYLYRFVNLSRSSLCNVLSTRSRCCDNSLPLYNARLQSVLDRDLDRKEMLGQHIMKVSYAFEGAYMFISKPARLTNNFVVTPVPNRSRL